jgi:hypothetical protein
MIANALGTYTLGAFVEGSIPEAAASSSREAWAAEPVLPARQE